MPTAVKNDEQPQSAPPVESVVRADGQPVNDQVEIEDEQRVAVVLVPDASGCAVIGISQSEAALNAGEQPLQTAEAGAKNLGDCLGHAGLLVFSSGDYSK
jgi:hypothetical protein